MQSRSWRLRGRRAAFTLLEAVIGTALFCMILIGGGQILFSITQALLIVQTEPRNLNHADAVTNFLDYAFQQCVERRASRADAPSWKMPPGLNVETLYFELGGGHPFFVSSMQPPPNAQSYLVFPKEGGLELVWSFATQGQQSGQQRRRASGGGQTLERLQLSPYVVDLEYHYSRGEDESEFVSARDTEAVRKGDWKLEGLRLTFEIGSSTETRYIRLGPRLGKVLLF